MVIFGGRKRFGSLMTIVDAVPAAGVIRADSTFRTVIMILRREGRHAAEDMLTAVINRVGHRTRISGIEIGDVTRGLQHPMGVNLIAEPCKTAVL